MANEQEIQKKYVEYQTIEQHISKLQEQLSVINQQIENIVTLAATLQELSKAKSGAKTYSQIGPGVFVQTELKENKNVLVNVGADVVVVKTIEETKTDVEKQLSELKGVVANVTNEIEKFTLYYQNLQQEIKGMIEKKE